MGEILDSNTKVDYLRIAITDRCDFRCIYCMPAEGIEPRGPDGLLSKDEIVSIAGLAAGEGIRRVRLTGGEPLMRKDCVELVHSLTQLEGIEEVSLTTNGSRLEDLAQPLKEAGLARINVSLDSLSPERFAFITRGGSLTKTLRGIKAASLAGLAPVKLNVVILPGLEKELKKFVELVSRYPFHVRFIEQMNIGAWRDSFQQQFVPYQKIKLMLEHWSPLLPATAPAGAGPARYYRLPESRGTIGFISAVSQGACLRCRRLRLTADGKIKSCLFSSPELDVRSELADIPAVHVMIRQAIAAKSVPLGLRGASNATRTMCQIGG